MLLALLTGFPLNLLLAAFRNDFWLIDSTAANQPETMLRNVYQATVILARS